MLRLVQSMLPVQRLEKDPDSRIFEIFDYWGHQPKLSLTVPFQGKEHLVEYVLAPLSFLRTFSDSRNEKFGFHTHDMMFINATLAKDRPKWIPYVVLKLFMEGFMDRGLDQSGRASHWQALYSTIRFAGATMSKEELQEFIYLISLEESTKYFELDREVREFLERAGFPGGKLDPNLPFVLESKRRYLDRHHACKWVSIGRKEELIASLAEGSLAIWRNHSEFLAKQVSNASERIYEMAAFVHQVLSLNEGEAVIISPPYNSFAYLMTQEGNGLVNLVEFIDPGEFGINLLSPKDDVVRILPGRRRTWVALGKRLSWLIHREERAVRALIKERKIRLDSFISDARSTTTAFTQKIEEVKALVAARKPIDPVIIEQLTGDWQAQLVQMSQINEEISLNLRSLDELSVALKTLI